jgi:hypothetical protein
MPIRGRNALLIKSHSDTTRLLGILVMALGYQVFGCAKATVGNVGPNDDGGTGDAALQSDGRDTSNPNGKKDGTGSDALYDPCDPFTNSGCSNSQKCAALRNGSALALGCGSKGSKAEGETCTPVMPGTLQTGDDCGDRLACFSVGSETSATCRRICPIVGTANACPSSETCSVKVGTFADSTGLAFCQATTACLPLEQTGCPTNQGCYYADKVGAICAPAGAKNPGDTCSNANDCVKGSTCLTLGSTGTCFSFCSTSNSGTCPSGMTCSALGGSSDEANLGSCRQQP